MSTVAHSGHKLLYIVHADSTRGGLFKRQSDLVVTILTLCVITGLVSALMVSLGIAVLVRFIN